MTDTQQIRVLDNILADQIAAGEVVERPSSVVKELVENAVDSGAKQIHIAIAEGGRTLIRVTDDGSGMGRADAELCIRRHATSKLTCQQDLFAIRTLGFRGEALPSIASVARLRITTRRAADAEGTRVEVVGGVVQEVAPIGCAVGTTVEVTQLFRNVPARLKFLKATATESGHVAGICTRIALVHPQLRITLERDGRTAREYLPVGHFSERLAELFAGEKLSTLDVAVGELRATAVLSAPERGRNGATGLHLFVNGRPVKDIALARAVAFAYGSVLPPGRYPLGGVDIRVPPDEVDVNVHPQKSEVRFKEGRALMQGLTRALAAQLGTSAFRGPATRARQYWDERLSPGPKIADRPESAEALFGTAPRPQRAGRASWPADAGLHAEQPAAPEQPRPLPIKDARASDDLQAHSTPTDAASAADLNLAASAAGDAPQAPSAFPAAHSITADPIPMGAHGLLDAHNGPAGRHAPFSQLRVLGQAKHMLLICEGADALYVIDQHAADERVRYAQLRKEYGQGAVRTQQLLFPERVTCTEDEVALLEEHMATIEKTGLECRALGPTTVAIHCVPVLLSKAAPEQLLRDLLAELSGDGDRAFGDAIDTALATMACHSAIRAGDRLSVEEGAALLRSLDQVQDFGGHCPHGRPVAHRLPFDDLERKLGR